MNTKTKMLFLTSALAVSLLSSCAVALATEGIDRPTGQGFSETHKTEVFGLGSLRERLRETAALSFGAKLGLKIEIDGLLERFRVAHETGGEMRTLRRPFDSLLTRIRLSLDRDPQLAVDIGASQDAIWGMLTDPAKFAKMS